MNESLKKLNVTVEEHGEQIELTAKQAEEIAKRTKAYTEALNENQIKIEALKEAQAQLNNRNKLEGKLLAAKAGSYHALSAEYSLSLARLKQLTIEERRTTEEGKKLTQSVNDLNNQLKELDKEVGNNQRSVGDYGKALDGIGGKFGDWIGQLKSTKQSFSDMKEGLAGQVSSLGKFRVALISTGIGALIVLIGSLYSWFTKSQKGIDTLNQYLTGFGAVVDVVFGRAIKLGGAFISIFTDGFKVAGQKAKEAFTGIGAEIVADFKEAKDIETTMQGINRESRDLSVRSAQTRAEIEKLKKLSEDTTQSTTVRARAANEAHNLENGLLKDKEKLLSKEVEQIKRKNALGEVSEENLQTLADKEIELAQVREESFGKQTELQNKINEFAREGVEKEKERKSKVKELSIEIENANAKVGGTAAVARLEYDRAIEKIEQLKKEAKGLGASFDFSSLELIAEAEFIRKLDKPIEGIKREFEKEGGVAGLKFVSSLDKALKEELPKTLKNIKAVKLPKETFFDVLSGGGSLFDALGFNLKDEQEEGIKSSFGFIKDQLKGLFDFKKQQADENLQLANQEISSAERIYQAEIANRNAGYANRVEGAKKELELARENQKKALKEQEKAAKQQLAINTIQEGSNLVLASAKIFGQIGNPLIAIPLIALMFGAFAGAKIKAFQLAKKKLRKGDYEVLRGGSHESGDDINLGYQSEGKQVYAEGGEGLAVFNRGATRKYNNILPQLVDAINKEKLEERLLNITDRKGKEVVVINNTGNNKAVEAYLKKLVQQGEEQEQVYDNGKTVRKGNRIIRYV
jgi:hypothetical protein